jgi:hypothetical protein
MIKTVLKRFLKAFIAGGLASVAALLASGFQLKELKDLQTLAFALGIAFFTGGLMALEKLIRWQDIPQ